MSEQGIEYNSGQASDDNMDIQGDDRGDDVLETVTSDSNSESEWEEKSQGIERSQTMVSEYETTDPKTMESERNDNVGQEGTHTASPPDTPKSNLEDSLNSSAFEKGPGSIADEELKADLGMIKKELKDVKKSKKAQKSDPTYKFRKKCEKLPKGVGCCRTICCQLRCHICCAISLVMFVILAVFIITFSVSLDTTVNDMMGVIREEGFEKTFNRINSLFLEAERLTMIVNEAFKHGTVDINDSQEVAAFLWNMITPLDSSFTGMYVGFPDSHFIFVDHYPAVCETGEWPYEVSNGSAFTTHCVSIDNKTENRIADSYKSGYNCVKRSWYVNAMRLENISAIAWTDVYVNLRESEDEENRAFYTITLSIKDKLGNTIAIFAIDLTGTVMSDFVEKIDVREEGRIVIMEKDGKLISVNRKEIPLGSEGADQKRYKAKDSEDEIVAMLGEMVEEDDSNREFTEFVGMKNTFVKIRNFNSYYNDRSWILAFALVRSDFDQGAVIAIIVSSILVAMFILIILCCMNCCSCCIFRRVQKLSKKMKRVSDMKFSKVRVSRLHMFSEIASIELSFYKMAKTILEYRAFLPDYLKNPEQDEEKKIDESDFELKESDVEDGSTHRYSDAVERHESSLRSASSNPDGSDSAYVKNKSGSIKSADNDFRLTSNNSVPSDCSSCSTISSIGSAQRYGLYGMQSKKITKKKMKEMKTSVDFDARQVTLVCISLDSGVHSGLYGDRLNLGFELVLIKLELMISKYRGTILSFSESEILCGFNCGVKQNMWSGHLIRGVEFAIRTKEILKTTKNRFRIGIARGMTHIHTFGTVKNRIRKVVGDVEKIARNLSKIGEWNIVNINVNEAIELPKGVICKSYEIAVMPQLERNSSFFFVCEVVTIVPKERSKEWMYVKEMEDKVKNLNLHMDCVRRILMKTGTRNLESVKMIIRTQLKDPFLLGLVSGIDSSQSKTLEECLRKKKFEMMETMGRHIKGIDFFYLVLPVEEKKEKKEENEETTVDGDEATHGSTKIDGGDEE